MSTGQNGSCLSHPGGGGAGVRNPGPFSVGVEKFGAWKGELWMEKIINFVGKQETPAPENGIVQTKKQKLAAWSMMLPSLERQGIAAAMDYIDGLPGEEKTTAYLALTKVISPRIKGIRVHKNDVRSRTLVGARVNRDFADLCKAAAKTSGRSLTKWVYAALWDALLKQGSIVENELPKNSNDIWYGWR